MKNIVKAALLMNMAGRPLSLDRRLFIEASIAQMWDKKDIAVMSRIDEFLGTLDGDELSMLTDGDEEEMALIVAQAPHDIQQATDQLMDEIYEALS